MYRGSHIAPHERIDGIGLDEGGCNNERSVTFGGWPGVRILGVLKKYRKVDTNFLCKKNVWDPLAHYPPQAPPSLP